MPNENSGSAAAAAAQLAKSNIGTIDDKDASDINKTLRTELASKDALLVQRDQAVAALNEEVNNLRNIVVQRDEGIRFLRLEVGRLSPEPSEQREWWDVQFATSWEVASGPAQSSHFMQRLIANLPERERRFLASNRLRILDWGCATGDGLNELAAAFPGCKAIGLDLSRVAVGKARLKFPALTFITTERGTFDEQFDVIFTSNCLEHFDAPLEWLERLLVASRWLVIVLVPYRERQLIEGHKVSFCEESFPAVFRGFCRLHAKAIQVNPAFWFGDQILVVYGSKKYVRECLTAAERRFLSSEVFQDTP